MLYRCFQSILSNNLGLAAGGGRKRGLEVTAEAGAGGGGASHVRPRRRRGIAPPGQRLVPTAPRMPPALTSTASRRHQVTAWPVIVPSYPFDLARFFHSEKSGILRGKSGEKYQCDLQPSKWQLDSEVLFIQVCLLNRFVFELVNQSVRAYCRSAICERESGFYIDVLFIPK